MKTFTAALIAATMLTAPAYAWDMKPVTPSILVLENEAGMVTQVPDLTAKECSMAVALLAPQSYSCGSGGCVTTAITGTISTMGAWNTLPSQAKPATSKLTTAKCVVPAQDSK